MEKISPCLPLMSSDCSASTVDRKLYLLVKKLVTTANPQPDNEHLRSGAVCILRKWRRPYTIPSWFMEVPNRQILVAL